MFSVNCFKRLYISYRNVLHTTTNTTAIRRITIYQKLAKVVKSSVVIVTEINVLQSLK